MFTPKLNRTHGTKLPFPIILWLKNLCLSTFPFRYLGNVDVCKTVQDLIKIKYLKNINDILSYTIHCTVPALSPPSTGIAKLIQETKTNNVEGM
jgi:hypothetical protein